MALTPELIKSNERLATLSDEQVSAIATLSVNDEATVINAKVGEHHGLIEADVLQISGIEKNDGERAYDYMKRVMSSYKEQTGSAETLQQTINNQKATIADLNKKINDGSTDEALKQQLTDAKSNLAQLQNQYDADKTAWDKEKEGFSEKITSIQVNSAIGKATSKLKFKAAYPENVQKTLLDSAKATVLSKYTPDWVESEGEKVMVFRDEKGEIVRNKSNSLHPYTAKELITEQLGDVLDGERSKKGGGTGAPPGGGGVEDIEEVDIAQAKTQIEADELIVKHLMQKGVTRGSQEFADQQKKLRNGNNVSKLPIR